MAHIAPGTRIREDLSIQAAQRQYGFAIAAEVPGDIRVRINDAQVDSQSYRITLNVDRTGGNVRFLTQREAGSAFLTLVDDQRLTIERDTPAIRLTRFDASGYATGAGVEAMADRQMRILQEAVQSVADVVASERALVGQAVVDYLEANPPQAGLDQGAVQALIAQATGDFLTASAIRAYGLAATGDVAARTGLATLMAAAASNDERFSYNDLKDRLAVATTTADGLMASTDKDVLSRLQGEYIYRQTIEPEIETSMATVSVDTTLALVATGIIQSSVNLEIINNDTGDILPARDFTFASLLFTPRPSAGDTLAAANSIAVTIGSATARISIAGNGNLLFQGPAAEYTIIARVQRFSVDLFALNSIHNTIRRADLVALMAGATVPAQQLSYDDLKDKPGITAISPVYATSVALPTSGFPTGTAQQLIWTSGNAGDRWTLTPASGNPFLVHTNGSVIAFLAGAALSANATSIVVDSYIGSARQGRVALPLGPGAGVTDVDVAPPAGLSNTEAILPIKTGTGGSGGKTMKLLFYVYEPDGSQAIQLLSDGHNPDANTTLRVHLGGAYFT